MMAQVRRSPNIGGSGTLAVGGALLCGFETTWGDGAFPVLTDRDAAGGLVRVRIDLGQERAVENVRRLTGGR